ncbi:hypothetical protein ACH4SP_33720 [Streptomyces sp. NPDC021093]|uniref:hypothetical protein n=1 Tax=Streptomyces sp. NPDC021093 TaxID=3365112 RepID=UPI0037894B80
MNKGYGKKRTLARTTLAVVSCAVALTACGGPAEPAARTDGKPAAAPKPLSQTALTARALTPGEETGPYRAGEYTVSGGPLSDDYTAAPAVCQPLVGLRAARGGPAAQVHRRLADPGKPQGTDVAVQLRTYAAGRAAGVLADLRTAGQKCAGGFAEVRGAARGTYTAVGKLPAPAGVGDEAQAFRLTLLDGKDGAPSYEYLTVVRSGPTVLSFRAQTLESADLGGVPKEIVDAQWEKFSSLKR